MPKTYAHFFFFFWKNEQKAYVSVLLDIFETRVGEIQKLIWYTSFKTQNCQIIFYFDC